ncbi:hypothetical protein [Pantoea vagans]|uniref:hypothetical protein n=1 Tax=Pantoea vagans TaxID=470934 RepID=UPI003B018929
MENMIIEFRKIAPYIAENVRAVITDHMSNAQIMAVINAEILTFFTKQQVFTERYLAFTPDQRAMFSRVMYSALRSLAKKGTPAPV